MLRWNCHEVIGAEEDTNERNLKGNAMRKLMLITVAALALAGPAAAQEFSNPVIPGGGCTQPYIVKEGDNLWTLADLRLQNPDLWQWLVQQNPLLQQPGRQYVENGMSYVMIRPGELLYCLDEAGINIGSTSTVTPEGTGGTITIVGKTFAEKLGEWLDDNWGWLLLLLGIGIVAWFLRELGKDPVRSGPPQVSGGVNDETVRNHFERRGTERGFTLIPGSTVRGRGYGRMMVSYRGGAEHPRTLNGETIYRASARFYDGRQGDVFMLQACGNDVTYGGNVYRLLNNFRFVEDEAIAEPSPEPVVETVTVPPVAPVEPSTDFEGELAPGTIHGSVQGPRTPGDKAVLRIQGAQLNGLTFTMTDRDLTVRWLPDDTE